MTFIFMGKEFKHGREACRFFVRLFNRELGSFDDCKVHERIILQGKQKKLRISFFITAIGMSLNILTNLISIPVLELKSLTSEGNLDHLLWW